MRFTAVGIIRLVAGVSGVAAVLATLLDTASRTPINPFNFFGFFTIQSNVLFSLTIIITAVATLRGRLQGRSLVFVRGCVTTYIFLVGVVYNALLSGLEGGVALPWANAMTHVVLPIYGVLDWVLFADRPPLPWERMWAVLLFPLVWLVVVLTRGATDGWVPYPFLDPATGYGSVSIYCVAICAFTVLAAAGAWAVSRLNFIRLSPSSPPPLAEASRSAA